MNLSRFPYNFSCTLTEAQNDYLNRYCTENNIGKTTIIRLALKKYFNITARVQGSKPFPEDEE